MSALGLFFVFFLFLPPPSFKGSNTGGQDCFSLLLETGTHTIAQAGLELRDILYVCLLSTGMKGMNLEPQERSTLLPRQSSSSVRMASAGRSYHVFFFFFNCLGVWRDGLAVNISFCSSRRPGFES